MNEDENNLFDFLREKRKKTKYIYMSLHPASGQTLTQKRKDNICYIDIAGKIEKFKNIRESVYDNLVDLYDKRSN